MVVEECHEPHLRIGIVVRGNVGVMVGDLSGVAAGRGKHAVDQKIKRVIQDGIQLKSPAPWVPVNEPQSASLVS